MRLSIWALCAIRLACASVATADVTFSDTEFNNGDWGFETATIAPGGSSAGTQTGGGNPGNARQLTNSVNSGGTVFGFSRYGTTLGTRYELNTQGAIASVDWTIDSRWLSGIGGQGHSIGLGVKQGTVVYIADFEITGSSGNWNTHGGIGLTAADFSPLIAGPAIDFSSTGAPLRFGFIVGNSSTGGAYTNAVLYDNFSFTVHSVPAPGAGGLAVLAAVAGLRRRRR